MNDIVELAKERRTRLVAEMARLDEFIRMAEALQIPDKDGDVDLLGETGQGALNDDLLLSMDQFLLIENSELDLDNASAKGSGKGKAKAVGAANSDSADDDDNTPEDELLLTDAVADSDSKLDTHVGMRIRHRRWMMGIDQQELAKLSGLTAAQIQRFESGEGRAGTRQMREIAAAMKVPLAFFVEGLADESGHASESRDGASPPR
jgi:ribosome-binding protein aMBF1 (putative translation factor)